MDYKKISEELKKKLQEIETFKDKLNLKDSYKDSDNPPTLKPPKKDFKEYNNIISPVEKGGLNFGIHIDHFTGKYNSSNKKIGLWKEEKEENNLEYRYEGQYDNGLRIGIWKEEISGPYQTQKEFGYIIRCRGKYVNGFKHGKWEYLFILGGSLQHDSYFQYGIGYFERGNKVGVWERRNDPDGSDGDPDKLIERIHYNPSGKIQRKFLSTTSFRWDEDKIFLGHFFGSINY